MADAAPVDPVERVAQYVVTSENRAEFMDKKLDIAKPVEKIVAPDAKLEIPVLGEKKEEVKTAEPQKEAAPEEKKEHPIKERFSEMAAKRREAEAREKVALERAEKAEREAAELRTKGAPPSPEQKPDTLGAAPRREEFKSDDEYIDAKVAYGVKKDRIEQAAVAEKNRIEAETTKVLTTWQERLDATRTEIEDFDEKIDNAKSVVFSNQVRDAILESPMGPRILYYFAEHKEEAEKLKGLSALSAIRAIGRLEADLTPKEKAATSPSKAEVQVSKAPAPISPLKGASAPESPVDSDGKFKGTYAQFKQLRKEKKI